MGAQHPSYGSSLPVNVEEGTADPAPVVLALRGFGSISGKVVRQGVPQAGVTITEASKGGGAALAFAQTDEAGKFTLAKVAEGPHVLQAMQGRGFGSMKSTSVTVTVVAGQEAAVTIDIPVGQISLTVQPKALPGQAIDAAQVFMFAGLVAPTNGKQLRDSFLQGGAIGMKIWFGEGKPLPEFTELVPGEYSVCTVPLSGNIMDPTYGKRLQEQAGLLKVYCRQMKLPASPLKQTMVHEVPAMTPLPAN